MPEMFSREERSRIMSRVRGKNTTPELLVRRLVHRMGYRFRLHRSDLPGKPDLAFPARRKIIFIHGCWWHHHDCRSGRKLAQTNVEYWSAKIARNAKRDARAVRELRALGWRTLVVWECETRRGCQLENRIVRFLG